MNNFGLDSTAEEVAHGHDLQGKVAIVTGGNSGIGQETARVLALHGCRVIITSRRGPAAEEAISKMQEKNGKVQTDGLPPAGELSYVLLDLADLDSVKAGVEEILNKTTAVDYLILNAGVMGCPYSKTKQNMELQIGTNHFGHFALTKWLLPRLSNPPTRVVVLSSTANRLGNVELDDLHFTKGRAYDPWVAYGQSKVANILFAKELNDRAGGAYIAASVHPGAIDTNLTRHMPWAKLAMFRVLSYIPGAITMILGQPLKSIGQGAATTMWAALKDGVKGGEYCVDCAVAQPKNQQGCDEELQKKLWEKTEEQLGEIEASGALQD